ncbi:hypothetical protein DFS34DRAFT_697235 [Phlyctochytrium arcticum]|nr:hypothetical protein DFS34DRAFT_697235 [Phlyctochytrium arcticum]
MVRLSSIAAIVATGALALSANTVDAKPCTKTDARFVGQKAVLRQGALAYPTNGTFTVSGTAEVVDGCTFIIRDFRYTPALAGGVDWYGRRGNLGTSGISVAKGVEASTAGDSPIFTFVDTVGAAASWDDFDTLVLFSPTLNFELANAQFTSLVSNATSTATASTTAVATSTAVATTTTAPPKASTTATTTSARPTTTVNVNSGAEGLGAGGLAAAGIAAAAAIILGA